MGFPEEYDLLQASNMPKKAPLAARPPADDISKELEYLYAHLAAVEALIRALEHYREFGPHLIVEHTGTA